MDKTTEEYENLMYRIDNEGFDGAFVHYSDFSEIEDEKFHELRQAYIKAHNDLNAYIGYEDWLYEEECD